MFFDNKEKVPKEEIYIKDKNILLLMIKMKYLKNKNHHLNTPPYKEEKFLLFWEDLKN